MILNLMPCVFPVLAIKVVGFARHGANQRRQRVGGLAYSAGVVLSFVALGALMLALRGAGEQLGWGFQLQSPAVVAALAVLFTVIGLNLAGLFEFGQFVPGSVAALEAKNPSVDAFLSGVLAVVIASPCTAPFMGASLGLALGLPAGQALAIFATLGIGMALPYLAASWSPALARQLPRPGAWMNTFRHAMAFPMFATVVWLVWVLGQQSGIDGAAALLALLLSLALVIWALGLQGRSRVVMATLSVAALAFLLGSIGHNVTKPLENCRHHGQHGAVATLGAGQGGAGAGHGCAGVCGFHRGLVRDLPVQQENHARQCRGAGRLCCPKSHAAARRLDAPRPDDYRRAGATGAQRRAGVRALPDGPRARGAVGNPVGGRGARRAGDALSCSPEESTRHPRVGGRRPLWNATISGMNSTPTSSSFAPLKNDTFLRACLRQATDYTPIWMMRQAGRFLPEYRATRAKAGSFMGLATNTDYATEVTLQPLERFPIDAAILFSDILTVPDAMGLGLSFALGEGPRFASPGARRSGRCQARSARHGQAALCVRCCHLDPQGLERHGCR